MVVLVGLAACQTGTGTAPTLEPTPISTPESVAQVAADGVALEMRMPPGWQSIPNDYGILLAEHTELVSNTPPDGLLVYVFVQGMSDLDLELVADDNPAFKLLNHVTRLPDASLGDSTISSTVPFRLGMSEAAYYLLSDAHDNRTLVLALDGGAGKVIVCNVSASRHDAQRIRAVLPMLLSNLTIDGQPVDMDGLDRLPDPLIFPEHRRREHDYPDTTREPVPDSTPES